MKSEGLRCDLSSSATPIAGVQLATASNRVRFRVRFRVRVRVKVNV